MTKACCHASDGQKRAFERVYDASDERWAFHDDPDPFVRYLRDRRLRVALELLDRHASLDRGRCRVLIVCGGVGGEATFLLNSGFRDVTVSDVAENALEVCRRRESRARTLVLDAERLDVPDDTYDLALVQDGLHHLPRPVLGYTEMLRVASRAVVVIEPHDGMVGRLLGREWEDHDGERNYVFRWTGRVHEQAARAYLRDDVAQIVARRLWDHNVVVGRAARRLARGDSGDALRCARRMYATLAPFDRFGNMLVGVVVKRV
jgi:ubiquinone/menaquinone biosynthesis C-methylase UbiE